MRHVLTAPDSTPDEKLAINPDSANFDFRTS